LYYKDKNVQDHEERMDHGAKEDKKKDALRHLARHRADAEELLGDAAKTKQDWDTGEERWTGTRPSPETDPYVQDDIAQRIKRLFVPGAVGTAAELVMAFVMGGSWLVGTYLEAGLKGVFLAIVGMFALKLAWTAGLKDHTNPEPSFKRRERVLRWVGTVTAGAFLGFILIRVFALPDLAEKILLVIFLIGVPVFASGALALASMLRVRNNLAVKYKNVRSAFLERLILMNKMEAVLNPDELERHLHLGEAIERGLSPVRPVRSVPAVQATVGLLFFLLLLPGIGNALTLEFWTDNSGSVAKEVEVPALGDIAAAVTRAGNLERVEVFGFADGLDVLRTPAAVISIPSRPSSSPCEAGREGLRLLKDAAGRATAGCDKKNQAALASYESELDARAALLVTKLRSLEGRAPSQATCVYQLISRCIGEGPDRVCLVLTDGVQECAVPPRPTHRGGARVVVILVPRNGDHASAVERLEARTRSIKAYVPQVVVIPVFEAESALPRLINNR
jgi:hypothetical protein